MLNLLYEKNFIYLPKFSISFKSINKEKVLYEKKCLLGLNLSCVTKPEYMQDLK